MKWEQGDKERGRSGLHSCSAEGSSFLSSLRIVIVLAYGGRGGLIGFEREEEVEEDIVYMLVDFIGMVTRDQVRSLEMS